MTQPNGTAQKPIERTRLSDAERVRIERQIRQSWNTRWPVGDSWVRGYAEDCQKLLHEIDRLGAELARFTA